MAQARHRQQKDEAFYTRIYGKRFARFIAESEQALSRLSDEELDRIHNRYRDSPEVKQAFDEADAIFEQWKEEVKSRDLRRSARPGGAGSG